METKVKQRNSNLELFRIITMLLIVMHHYVVNSGLAAEIGPMYSSPMSWRSLFLFIAGAFGKTGINCFVLITGYFMCKSNITGKKFIKLVLEVLFYRIVIGAIFMITRYEPITLKSILTMLLPVKDIAQNFTGCYLIFFLCIPFLNILIHNLSEKQHIKLLLLMMFTYVVLGTVPFFKVDMNYVSWFIVLYFLASYIRLYPKTLYENNKLWTTMTIVFIVFEILSVVGCAWLGNILNKKAAYLFVADSNTFLAVGTGICSFLMFKNLKMKNNKFINTVSASTFGVLLIHANCEAMRRWLWQDVLHNVEMYNSNYVVLHIIVSVLVVYAVCTAIDWLRIQFIEKPFFRKTEKLGEKIVEIYRKKEDAFCEKYNIGR